MQKHTDRLKHVTLVHNTTTDPEHRYRDKAARFLNDAGIQTDSVPVAGRECPEFSPQLSQSDMVIVMGGDGTFLRTAQFFSQHQVPLVGVNTGTLGFLTRIEVDKLAIFLKLLVMGEYELEERMMLSVKDSSWSESRTQLALNDVVIKNGSPSQMCTLRVYINDDLLAIYDADGIVLSTPTGSTAYTLSSGGPVISPEVEAMSITPICPHSLSAKPIVIPADKRLRVESMRRNKNIICAVDGQDMGPLQPGEILTIERAPLPLKMVNFRQEDDDFYHLLKKKLHWAMNPRWKTEASH